jgi:DNA-binding MarR family transcriptional regulator
MAARKLSQAHYQQLADARHTLTRFLRFSESAAGKAGLSSQQYHALLALRAAGTARPASIGHVARGLLIKHNSAVELVDRLVRQGLVDRRDSPQDRRKVELRVTPKGRRTLERLVHIHRQELDRLAAAMKDLQRMAHVSQARRHAGL